MRALIVYESMFGCTRQAAEAIRRGLDRHDVETTLTTAASAPRSTQGYELLVVGSPTHAHSLPRPASRMEAARWAANPAKKLTHEQSSPDAGVREWLATAEISDGTILLGAFSTRADILRALAGDAAVVIKRRLRALSDTPLETDCYLVDKTNRLVDGESERAEAWGISLATIASVSA